MCGIETYLDLVDNPLIEQNKIIQLEKRNNTQANIINDIIHEKNQAKKDFEKETKMFKANLKNQYDQKLKNLKKKLREVEGHKRQLKQQLKQYKNTKKVPKSVRKAVYKRDNYTCQSCGAKEDITIDHIVPRSKGGSNDVNNLQTLCESCNLRKKTQFIDYRKVKPLMVREAK